MVCASNARCAVMSAHEVTLREITAPLEPALRGGESINHLIAVLQKSHWLRTCS